MKSLFFRFGTALVARRNVIRRILLFSASSDMRTEYAFRLVVVIGLEYLGYLR